MHQRTTVVQLRHFTQLYFTQTYWFSKKIFQKFLTLPVPISDEEKNKVKFLFSHFFVVPQIKV